MTMGWFLPLAGVIGLMGTRTALKSRHALNFNPKAKGWWLLVLLAWMPSFCWIMAQFIAQY